MGTHFRRFPALVLGSCILGTGCIAMNMPGRSGQGSYDPPDLLDARERLRAHVEALAGGIGERNLLHPDALDAAAEYIRTALAASGYEVREQAFDVEGYRLYTPNGSRDVVGRTVRNLEARLAGQAPAGDERPDVVVVGAHYDTVPGSPGADDNASGVAALLELAHRLRSSAPRAEVRFVFFVNEEAPYYGGPEMGSLVYASACKAAGDRVVAMFSLETLGYYTDEKGSQRLPWYLRPFYPNRGNFVAFVADTASRRLVRRTVGAFRRSAEIDSRGAAIPRWVEGVSWSDHAAFWKVGYPALMVTDTAFLRNPHYHRASDLPGTLDLDRLAQVVLGLAAAVQEISRES